MAFHQAGLCESSLSSLQIRRRKMLIKGSYSYNVAIWHAATSQYEYACLPVMGLQQQRLLRCGCHKVGRHLVKCHFLFVTLSPSVIKICEIFHIELCVIHIPIDGNVCPISITHMGTNWNVLNRLTSKQFCGSSFDKLSSKLFHCFYLCKFANIWQTENTAFYIGKKEDVRKSTRLQ